MFRRIVCVPYPMVVDRLDIPSLIASKNKRTAFLGRQLMFSETPISKLVETYLYDNEGRPQKLNRFPMMRHIYDSQSPRLLLKCSRKTLKSTLVSNMLVLNALRYNKYAQLYVGPQEKTTQYFSNNYLGPRLDSPPLKRIIRGWKKNDVYEKTLRDSESVILLRYASEDATRIRGPAVDSVSYDECQDMHFDILPIIKETMSLSDYKRECFSGTPLTTDNTINQLWNRSTQYEWMMRCGCGHWNVLREENDPMSMIQPQGLSCSKCTKKLDARNGEWVQFNFGQTVELTGYHLAQPIIPRYNEVEKDWLEVYQKVHNGRYGLAQVFNEVFGLAYDIGSKPITLDQLKSLCVLGPMLAPGNDRLVNRLALVKSGKYKAFTCGVDWGVNMTTSRTTLCVIGIIDDKNFDVVFCKVYSGFDYEGHVREIAEIANYLQAFCASDSGPSPDRGIKLIELTSRLRSQMVRYEHGKMVQHEELGKGDFREKRWCLHRSDTFTILFDYLKGKDVKLRFPQFDDSCECLMDIMNIFLEVKDGLFRQELFYRHKPENPDDFGHALNFALMQALMLTQNSLLQSLSSSVRESDTN